MFSFRRVTAVMMYLHINRNAKTESEWDRDVHFSPVKHLFSAYLDIEEKQGYFFFLFLGFSVVKIFTRLRGEENPIW